MNLEIEPEMPKSGIFEVKELSSAVERMRTSISAFSKYTPKGIVNEILKSGGDASIGGMTKEVTLFFSDIEKMSSPLLVCEAKGDVAECYEIVRALYRRHRIRLPEKIRAFTAVPWLWKEYLRMVTNQLTILLDVCEETDQIYELEEYEE